MKKIRLTIGRRLALKRHREECATCHSEGNVAPVEDWNLPTSTIVIECVTSTVYMGFSSFLLKAWARPVKPSIDVRISMGLL